jgi:hypothetical protein
MSNRFEAEGMASRSWKTMEKFKKNQEAPVALSPIFLYGFM